MEGLIPRKDDDHASTEEVPAGVAGTLHPPGSRSDEGRSFVVDEPSGDQDRERVGVNPDTLRRWTKQNRIDAGEVPGTTTSDAARIRQLEQEVRELKRANEILMAASSFMRSGELDPRLP